jgi:hypothetical protein
VSDTKGPLQWKLEWVKSGDAKVTATLNATLSTGELSPSETSSLQEQMRALIVAVNLGITFDVPTP